MNIFPTLSQRIEMEPRIQARIAARKARYKTYGFLRKAGLLTIAGLFWGIFALYLVDSIATANNLDEFLGKFLTSPFGLLTIAIAGYFLLFWRAELLFRRLCRKLTGSRFDAQRIYDEEYARLTHGFVPKRIMRRPVTPRRRKRTVSAAPAYLDLERN